MVEVIEEDLFNLVENIKKIEDSKKASPRPYSFRDLEDNYNLRGNEDLISFSNECWERFKKSGAGSVGEFMKSVETSDFDDNSFFETPLAVKRKDFDKKKYDRIVGVSEGIIMNNIRHDIELLNKCEKEQNINPFFEFSDNKLKCKCHSLVTFLALQSIDSKEKFLEKTEGMLKKNNFDSSVLLESIGYLKKLRIELGRIIRQYSGHKLYDEYKKVLKWSLEPEKSYTKTFFEDLKFPSIACLAYLSYPHFALHESTHAVVAMLSGYGIHELRIMPFGAGGYTWVELPKSMENTWMTDARVAPIIIAPFVSNLVLASIFYVLLKYQRKKGRNNVSNVLFGICLAHFFEPVTYSAMTLFNFPGDLTMFATSLGLNYVDVGIGVLLAYFGTYLVLRKLTKKWGKKDRNATVDSDIKNFEKFYGKNASKIIDLITDVDSLFYSESNKAKGPIIHPETRYEIDEKVEIGRLTLVKTKNEDMRVKKVCRFFTIEELLELPNNQKDKIIKKLTKLAEKLYPSQKIRQRDAVNKHKECLERVFRLCQEYLLSTHDDYLRFWATLNSPVFEKLPQNIVIEEERTYKGVNMEKLAKQLAGRIIT